MIESHEFAGIASKSPADAGRPCALVADRGADDTDRPRHSFAGDGRHVRDGAFGGGLLSGCGGGWVDTDPVAVLGCRIPAHEFDCAGCASITRSQQNPIGIDTEPAVRCIDFSSRVASERATPALQLHPSGLGGGDQPALPVVFRNLHLEYAGGAVEHGDLGLVFGHAECPCSAVSGAVDQCGQHGAGRGARVSLWSADAGSGIRFPGGELQRRASRGLDPAAYAPANAADDAARTVGHASMEEPVHGQPSLVRTYRSAAVFVCFLHGTRCGFWCRRVGCQCRAHQLLLHHGLRHGRFCPWPGGVVRSGGWSAGPAVV